MYLWGLPNNGDYGWNNTAPEPANSYIRRYWNGSLELIAVMLDRYDFTQDRQFARDTLVPLADPLIAFLDQYWPKRDANGKDPSSIPRSRWRPGTSRSIRCRRSPACGSCCRACSPCRRTSPRADQRARWHEAARRAAAGAGRRGERRKTAAPGRIVFPPEQLREPGTVRRVSRTGCTASAGRTSTWPATPTRTAATATTVAGARTASRPPASASATKRAGWSPRGPRRSTAATASRSMWGPNFDWIPDQDHGNNILTTLQFMLLQSDGDRLFVLPAWPKNWNVSFKLHAPQQTTVEGVYRDGKLEQLIVTPESRRQDVVNCREQEGP